MCSAKKYVKRTKDGRQTDGCYYLGISVPSTGRAGPRLRTNLEEYVVVVSPILVQWFGRSSSVGSAVLSVSGQWSVANNGDNKLTNYASTRPLTLA
jgi:hypothetical protein